MNTIKNIVVHTLCLLAIVSCTKTDDKNPIVPSSVEIEADGESGSFVEGDEIGFYMTSSSESGTQNLSGERYCDNVKFTLIGNRFISNPAIYFPEDNAAYNDMYAYAPYKESLIPAGSSQAEVSVSADQNEVSEGNDFRVAVKRDVLATSGKPSLAFKHIFTKINLRIAPGGYYESVEEIPSSRSVTVKGVKVSGVYDFENNTFAAGGEATDLIPGGEWKADGSLLSGVSFILPPQRIVAGEVFLEMMMGDDSFLLKPETEIELQAGTEVNLTVKLNADFAGVLVNMDLDITEWENGNDFDMSEEEVLPPASDEVTDIDGNVYSIVRIGKQYWMESNLRTTHYNDGTPLTKSEDVSLWRGYTDEGAYVAYDYDESDLSRCGYLYNRYAVETDRICPDGWHVPTTTDWDKLGKALGGVIDDYHSWTGIATSMKSVDGWDGGHNGNNSSKFNAYPVGYLYCIVTEEGKEISRFYDKGSGARFWSATALSGATSFVRAVMAVDPDDAMSRFIASNENGYSVRCVHDF